MTVRPGHLALWLILTLYRSNSRSRS